MSRIIAGFVRIAKVLIDVSGCSIEEAISNTAIPEEFKEAVRAELENEELIVLRDINMVEDPNREHIPWLPNIDRDNWYYWPRLRNYLLDSKNWLAPTIRSIEDSTDKILGSMENPAGSSHFDTRALVVGYVQSGKTANYTALIAKSVDAGYRLIIVLAGMHNTLRYQTQVRLDKELVGILNGVPTGVGRPEPEKEWHTFTKADLLDGDFDPGNASSAALSGNQPVLVVVKKNGPVLRRLLNWLDQTQENTRRNLPCLIIDDEADQASINTGGNRPHDLDPEEIENEESPSTINELVRTLLGMFNKRAYIAYTATPFANVLIDHEASDIYSGADLYPRSFIAALPRPHGYFGASEIFGTTESGEDGLKIIRNVPKEEIPWLLPLRRNEVETFQPRLTESLTRAIKDFFLAGAARISRGTGKEPAAMLIHTSYRTLIQDRLTRLVDEEFRQLRDEWRYMRDDRLREELRQIWETDFRPTTRSNRIDLDVPFDEIEDNISAFIEQVEVRQLHSQSNDVIDYELEPELKVIVVGGNRLSRGLTLEGLLVSYFVRSTATYDTLMQMGRWFGYREGYADITRIYTTKHLERNFRELAIVEEELHREIARYDHLKLTPLQVGVKIRQHPAMLVTSPLKMRSSQVVNISYENQLLQTITFPLDNIGWLKSNLEATRDFLSKLGEPLAESQTNQPIWHISGSSDVLDFLREYQTDNQATRVRSDCMREYIMKQNEFNELNKWVIAVIGRNHEKNGIGDIDLGISGWPRINKIERTRIIGTSSLKAITSMRDQEIGLSGGQKSYAKDLSTEDNAKLTYPEALRHVRSPQEGLLLIYPISKFSGINLVDQEENREPLFSDPNFGEDVIGIAIVFPHSNTAATVEYLVGSVGVGSGD